LELIIEKDNFDQVLTVAYFLFGKCLFLGWLNIYIYNYLEKVKHLYLIYKPPNIK